MYAPISWTVASVLCVPPSLRFDNCNADGIDPKLRYPPMRDALNATGRPILFSMCEWGVEDPATWSAPPPKQLRQSPLCLTSRTHPALVTVPLLRNSQVLPCRQQLVSPLYPSPP